MATSSSDRKIERIQRAGASRAVGQSRPLGFPLGVLAIILIGAIAVFFSRQARVDSQNLQPQVGDNWRIAIGLYQCDKALDAPANSASSQDLAGFNSEDPASGIAVIAPKDSSSTGKFATMDKYLARVGIVVSKGEGGATSVSIERASGTPVNFKTGDTCAEADNPTGNPAEVVLFRWPPKATDSTSPERITDADEINRARFTEDNELFVLALVKKGTSNIPLPNTDALDSNAAPASTTTIDPAATTTLPADPAATTTIAVAPTTTAN